MYLHRREQQTKKGDLSASPLAAHVLISYLVRTQAAKKSGTASKIEIFPDCSAAHGGRDGELVNPFRAAVPFWGKSTQNPSRLSPKRDCGPERDERQNPVKRQKLNVKNNMTKKKSQNETYVLP